MPRRRAASTTMMLAIEPTISRLPARVLTSASIGPENGSVAAGSSSITAGGVGNPVGSTKGGAKNGARPGQGRPGGGGAGDALGGKAGGPEAGVPNEKADEKDHKHPVPQA